MIKALAKWLAGILRAELDRIEASAALEVKHLEGLLAELKTHIETVAANSKIHAEITAATVKAHVDEAVVRPTEALKAHVSAEISGQFDKIVSVTGVAAQEALAAARRTMRMICDTCGVLSWRFSVDPGGKIICGDCQIKADRK